MATKIKFPESARVEIRPQELAPGRFGYVQAISEALRVQGVRTDVDELACAAALPFTTYAYNPEINKHEDPRRHSWLAEHFSNYGVFESVSYYTGANVMVVNEIADAEHWDLIRFELSLGRPLISTGWGRANGPVLITGYRDGERKVVTVWDGAERDVILSGRPQLDSEVFVNFLVVVRADARVQVEDSARERMRQGALKWAVQHGNKWTEFFHESRENYLVGKAGAEFIANMAKSELEAEEAEWFASHLGCRIPSLKSARALLSWDPSLGDVVNELNAAAELWEKREFDQALERERLALRALEMRLSELQPPS